MNQIEQQLLQWAKARLKQEKLAVQHYTGHINYSLLFYIKQKSKTYFALVLSNPDTYNNAIKLTHFMEKHKLPVPKIMASDRERGFLLLSNVGDRTFQQELTTDNVNMLYLKAFDVLLALQQVQPAADFHLESFTKNRLKTEYASFRENVLEKFLNLKLTAEQQKIIVQAYRFLIDSTKSQPQVLIHSEFNTKNLLIKKKDQISMVGYENTMIGPITYDLVSLLKDCYIDWPIVQVTHWALQYFHKLEKLELLPKETTPEQFLRWFDLTGVLYHLKTTTHLAKLFLNDNQLRHVEHMPRTLNYVEFIIMHYPELKGFQDLFQQVILPRFYKRLRDLNHEINGTGSHSNWRMYSRHY